MQVFRLALAFEKVPGICTLKEGLAVEISKCYLSLHRPTYSMWIFDKALGSSSIVTATVVTAPFIHLLHALPGSMLNG